MVITTFVGLCKSEGLEAPTKAAGARSLLEGGGVATAGEDGKRLAAGVMVERAAALVWARAHRAGEDLELWEGLGDSFRAALEVLYPGGKARAGGSSMERVMRAVEFRTTPTVTPEKKKKRSKRRAGVGGDGGSDDEARAEEAVRAAAEAARAEKERRGGGREGGTPGGEERPGKKVRGSGARMRTRTWRFCCRQGGSGAVRRRAAGRRFASRRMRRSRSHPSTATSRA